MNSKNRRESERVVLRGSDEELVMVIRGGRRSVSRMLDLSDGGTLVYLLGDPEDSPKKGDACEISLHHEGGAFEIPATVARTTGRLIALQFGSPSPESSRLLQAKLARLHLEWERLRRLA